MRELERTLVREGSLPRGAAACLYLSAGSDTRPFSYLRPEVLTELGLPDSAFPRLFVLVDKWVEPDDPESTLAYRDDLTTVSTEKVGEVEPAGRDPRTRAR